MPTDAGLKEALGPVARSLVDRHLANAREWFPHEYVPWERGRAFENGYEWDVAEAPMDEAVRSALFVNLLTEDNLPHYFWTIDRTFGGDADDVWGEWTRRWTAEEGRHSIVIRDYLTVTRAVDPVALERGRMIQVSKGQVPLFESIAEGLCYVALQELATRISHGNTGRMMTDDVGRKIMARVAGDENLHHVFYRDLVSALIELDVSTAVIAIDQNVRAFAMPGLGIPGFDAHARAIAAAGIYDYAVHHDQILQPVVLTAWKLPELTGLSPEAEQARDRCLAHIERVGRAGRHLAEKRDGRGERKAS
ncbi:MAG: acyl-ACP desaturase [Acidobacteria bacterium]|nr:acyl-ACP desaturase [Acidobacteriota bacterium]